jgi:predicted acetyltransferase
MLYLKEANQADWKKEYGAVSQMPYYETGFGNRFYGYTADRFREQGIPWLLDSSEGVNLKEDRVPETYFFLWNDDEIVGLFKIRHYLNDDLREGAGHIGYGILESYRNKGYATAGLALAIEKCRQIIREDEIYLAAYSFNIPSIRVMLANGARIVGEKDGVTFTRISLNRQGGTDNESHKD